MKYTNIYFITPLTLKENQLLRPIDIIDRSRRISNDASILRRWLFVLKKTISMQRNVTKLWFC